VYTQDSALVEDLIDLSIAGIRNTLPERPLRSGIVLCLDGAQF
jgi:hypothetical protein